MSAILYNIKYKVIVGMSSERKSIKKFPHSVALLSATSLKAEL